MSCPALPVTVIRLLWLPAGPHGSALPMATRADYSGAGLRRHDRMNRSHIVSIIFIQRRSANPGSSWGIPGDFREEISLYNAGRPGEGPTGRQK